jgi:hypothetical protein
MRRFLGNSTPPSGIFGRSSLASDGYSEEIELAYSEGNATLDRGWSAPQPPSFLLLWDRCPRHRETE